MRQNKSSSSKLPLLKALLKFVFRGQFYMTNGHLAEQAHPIPDGFFGVGITASKEAKYDHYLLSALNELGIRHVRIDLCASIENKHQLALLERLIHEGFVVHLHLLQSFEDAQAMSFDLSKQKAWTEFIKEVTDKYGTQVEMLEIGSTVNRPRWAGYSIDGFVTAWKIAYKIIKQAGLRIAGPNITDFEPPYTTFFLDALKQANCLPDIYTNNLFAERATEPERFDHKVLGKRLASTAKFNLIKKAKITGRMAQQYGIQDFVSPSSFWTLPRIQRYTEKAEDKQADYLIRYFVLLAASNTVSKAFWGPLICHREGLIDEGDFDYPKLEKITYYGPLAGQTAQFKKRPAFYAFQTVTAWLSGSNYLNSYQHKGLQIYRFEKQNKIIDIAWTINGLAANIGDLYAEDFIDAANIYNQLGHSIGENPAFVTEQSIFMVWNRATAPQMPSTKPSAKEVQLIQICCDQNRHHYALEDEGWRAVIAANSKAEAQKLFDSLHPNKIAKPGQLNLLRKARNAVWSVSHPLDANKKLVAKKPLTSHFHKKILDYFKPSKAQKSWNSSSQLMRREIGVSAPIAFFENKHSKQFNQNIYISEAVTHIGSVREMFAHFMQGHSDYHGIPKESAYTALANFLLKMHARGVWFRDLSGGNVLITKAEQSFNFVLIDTNRARFSNYPLPMKQRISDLVRICNKLDWPNKYALMAPYMAALNQPFTLGQRLAFYLYDFKVNLKRTFGRKGIKKLKKALFAKK